MIEARYPTWCVSIVSLWFLQVFSLSMVPIGVFPPRFLGFPRYSNALAMFQAGRPCSMPVLKGMLLGAKKTARGEALAMLVKMIFWHANDVDFTMKLLQRWKP